MFEAKVYKDRRLKLTRELKNGLILLPGNHKSPINYSDNIYPFRQDSTFLYYLGVDRPGLVAIIDVDSGETTLFGDEQTTHDVVWSGRYTSLTELAETVGISHILPLKQVDGFIHSALSTERKIHFLPPYRSKTILQLAHWLSLAPKEIHQEISVELIQAIITQRSRKSKAELLEIESALEVTLEMHTMAMKMTRPGMVEREIAGIVEGIALAHGRNIAYPVIFSIRGEVLHNESHNNVMIDGSLVLIDAGADSPLHYASDITRVYPVNGKFTNQQREIYELVYAMQKTAYQFCGPGIAYRDAHLASAKTATEGLINLGLMKGDPDEAVAAGAHALFFPHGLGHMLGLDVHDMESLGEDNVGYNDRYKRSHQFGLTSLRLGKPLEEGNVITVEPGLYFIPQLIDRWFEDGKFLEFINYGRLESYRKFGGVRIEDNITITANGFRILGHPIPNKISHIENLMAG